MYSCIENIVLNIANKLHLDPNKKASSCQGYMHNHWSPFWKGHHENYTEIILCVKISHFYGSVFSRILPIDFNWEPELQNSLLHKTICTVLHIKAVNNFCQSIAIFFSLGSTKYWEWIFTITIILSSPLIEKLRIFFNLVKIDITWGIFI